MRLGLSLLLALVLCQRATAAGLSEEDLRKPQAEDLPPIQALIEKGNRSNVLLGETREALEDKEIEFEGLADGDPAKAEVGTEIRKLRQTVKKELTARNRAYDRALALSIISVTRNPWPAGRTYNALYPGAKTRWRAVARDNEEFIAKDSKGNIVSFPAAVQDDQGNLPGARTLPNGISVFHPEAFTGAEELILTVIHEMDHYVISKDWEAEQRVANADEVDCYQLEMDFSGFMPWRDPARQTLVEKWLKGKRDSEGQKEKGAGGRRERPGRTDL